ncbi:MAG TPA: tetratricopeptide repeat protein [Chitinophagales bacterium]|nr:tetratricopeptide repeat protein [Chitinophagales bacterium]
MEVLNKPEMELVAELKKLRVDRDPLFVEKSEKYLASAEDEMNKRLAAEILFQQVVYYNNVIGHYELSNRLSVTCLHYANLLSNKTLEANVLRMMGVNYDCLGHGMKARKAYDEGAAILETKAELTTEDKEILAGIYFNIVSLYKELDIDESRLVYIDKSFKLFTEIENKQGIARCYIAYANNFPDVKNSGLAIEYYRLAADIFGKINDRRGLGNCQVGIGYQLGLQGKFDEALTILYEGIENLKKSSNEFVTMQGYFNLAIVLRLQKRYDDAIYFLRLVQSISESYKVNMNMMFLYEEWALTLEERGDYKEALEYQKKYQQEREKAHQFDKDTTERSHA